jgi:hypothetical protein
MSTSGPSQVVKRTAAAGRAQRLTLIRYHRWNLPGSVHLRPKWTPIWSVHFRRMTPYSPPV